MIYSPFEGISNISLTLFTLQLLLNLILLGKVSAVLGALDGVMPMVSFSLYTAVYHSSVAFFPGAQFFFGAAVNCLMALIFV